MEQIKTQSKKVKQEVKEPVKQDAGSGEEPIPIDPVPISNLTTTLETLPGMTREKAKLEEKFFLPEEYPNLFPASSGFLLYGPPGTGKTEFARAFVGTLRERLKARVLQVFDDKSRESKLLLKEGTDKTNRVTFKVGKGENSTYPRYVNMQMFAPTGADFKSKFSGMSEKQVVSIFKTAQSAAEEIVEVYGEKTDELPNIVSVLFMDELDAIAPDRTKVSDPISVGTLNALLQAMQGIQAYDRVVRIGATNLVENIDSAALRRFPIKIFVDLPSDLARLEAIIRQLLKLMKMDKNKDTMTHATLRAARQLWPGLLGPLPKKKQVKPEEKVDSAFVNALATISLAIMKHTGMTITLPILLASQVSKKYASLADRMNENFWKMRLTKGHHALFSSETLSFPFLIPSNPCGYNFSDLNNVINDFYANMAALRLYGQLDSIEDRKNAKYCVFTAPPRVALDEESDDESSEESVSVTLCDQKDKKKAKIEQGHIVYAVQNHLWEYPLISALRENPSNVRLSEYAHMLVFDATDGSFM